MEAIYNFDLKIFNFISENLWSNWLDEIMKMITRLGDGGVFWIVIAGIFLLSKKYRKCGLVMLIALLCSELINNIILKNLIDRPRPFNYEAWKSFFVYPEIISKPSSSSFPSGHTATSFAAAFGLFMKNKKFGIPALVIAALIGFSRVYIHVHYATDVLAGVVVGIVCGIIAALLVKALLPLARKLLRIIKNKVKMSKKA